mmetsp:Transcript_30892/g.51134  ORF Transcript_30892/g.51134 Transcript_30892/m.51134 type:complete len:349 (-) Transcript_30892:261-1307(-)
MTDRSGHSVSSSRFYLEYHGHLTNHLSQVITSLRQDSHGNERSAIFLAGDSSLDNKAWFDNTAPALNGYEACLSGDMKQDVCYWINAEIVRRGHTGLFCINTAIEATTLSQRACGLLSQDAFIRDHIGPQDTLIVSVGGNDIAMAPMLFTVLNLVPLACCTPNFCLRHCMCACPPDLQFDCGCLGCGLPACLSATPFGWPPGAGYFADLFGHKVELYTKRLLARKRPRRVVVCMIYFLDEKSTGSWADPALCCLGYDCAPSRLQLMIRRVFELATSRIRIPGTEVVAFPLFRVLDGKTSSDYVQRVEPSASGGRKMGSALLDAVLGSDAVDAMSDDGSSSPCCLMMTR